MKSYFDGKRALVVINPISGRRTTKTQLFNITELFSVNGLETTVYTTRCKGDATDIVTRRGGSYDIVVCRGGDGTFNEVVNGMMTIAPQRRPLLGYIPAGSTNDLARTLQIPINDNAEAIGVILNGQPLWQDMGLFNEKDYWCYTASFGAFVDISYNTPQAMKNRWGRAAYFLQAPAALRGIHPIRMKVSTAEGFEEEGDFIFCAVSNSTSIAGTIKLSRSVVRLNDGRFELLLARYPKNLADVASMVSRVVLQQSNKDDRVRLLQTRRVEFEFGQPEPWTIDGEDAGTHTHVVVENVHNAVQVFRR
ncbi:MAG: diacylglycerol kinase family lipid kinase [Firmicutes bacterium]|nr:diacylglycerol kinase family lipid kinase [Bacillota bacterium]